MKKSTSLVSKGIVASLFAMILNSAFSETNEHAWCSDVTGMRYAFDRLADDVAKHRENNPFLEREFYEHILELPVSVDSPHLVSLMMKKRELLDKAHGRLEYCKTNETAFLMLAVHLGLLLEIPTNTFHTESIRARIEDNKDRDMARAQTGFSPCGKYRYTGNPPGAHLRAWEKRSRAIQKWNSTIKEYRRGVLEDVRENLLKCESRLDKREALTLRFLFSRAARLTAEEKEFMFGSSPKTAGDTSGGAITNSTTVVP